MERTRHRTATIYVVNNGAVALHDHERIGRTIPPGGHVDRGELPHEAALRECREETGLEATIVDDEETETASGRVLPRPRHQMLYDVNVHPDGEIGHQHVDDLFYASVPSRDIDPAPGEAPPSDWAWYDADALRSGAVDDDVITFGLEAIDAVAGQNG